MDPKPKSLRTKLILTAIMLVGATLSVLRSDSFQVGAYHDDAHYIVLANSIASGHGYRLINYPSAPVEQAFPPGWPLLLSPFVALFPNNFTVLKLLPFLFYLASIPLTYRLFARRIATPYLELLTALVALNPILIGASGMLMSETPYLFFSLLTLNLLEYWDEHRANNWLLIAVVAAAFYTQLVRTVGLSLLISVVAYLMALRRFRQSAMAAGMIALGMLGQFWFNSQNNGSLVSSGYESQVFSGSVGTKITHVWLNFHDYATSVVTAILVPIFGPQIQSALQKVGLGGGLLLLNIMVLLTLLAGVILSLRHFRASDLYAGIYFAAILTFWNPDVGSTQERFLIPLLPFLYFYLLYAIFTFARWISHGREGRAAAIVAAAITLVLLISTARNIQDWRNPLRNQIPDLSLGTTWAANNTPPDAILMARNPVPGYLYAERKTVDYPSDRDPVSSQGIRSYIRRNKVDYVIVSPPIQVQSPNQLDTFTTASLLPFLVSDPAEFRLVYRNPQHNVSVYEYQERTKNRG